MKFDAILLAPRREQSIARGWWHDRTINHELDACVAAYPDKLALTALRSETGELRRFSYRELSALADRIAVGLARLGVGRNDVVAMQLPNWWQFSLLYLACSRIGAVLKRGRLAILAPYRWLRSADVLPHGWEATSDSVAAFVAGALDASRLILVKPADDLAEPVDQAFPGVVPAGLPVSIVGWQRLEAALSS